MLTDAILQEATAEVERFLLSAVPEEEGEPHRFSIRFEKKMGKLIRRANHPICYQVLRAAAAVLIVIATLFGTLMAVSPDVRAAVVGWVKEVFGGYSVYSNSSTDSPTRYDYCLSVLPNGYREWKVHESKDAKSYLFINSDGDILQFTYDYSTTNSAIFIETENYEQHTAFVNDLQAEVYIALSEDETSVIVWQDPNTNTLFDISASEDIEGLVKLAESVVRIEN